MSQQKDCIQFSWLCPSHLLTLLAVAAMAQLYLKAALLSTEMAMEAAGLNNSHRGEREVLFFNRVPKVNGQRQYKFK
jgi:hypothetical protein